MTRTALFTRLRRMEADALPGRYPTQEPAMPKTTALDATDYEPVGPQLLPCPFCGKAPHVWDVNKPPIFCVACSVQPQTNDGLSWAQAIAAWNTRADLAIAQAVKAETERCAVIAENAAPVFQDGIGDECRAICANIAAAIRARNSTEGA